jgi:hypothetical protein
MDSKTDIPSVKIVDYPTLYLDGELNDALLSNYRSHLFLP